MTTDNIQKIVKWLISERKALSQRDLAVKLGYNPSSFSQIIRGHVPVSDKFIRRLTNFDPRVNEEWVRTGEGIMVRELDDYARMMAELDEKPTIIQKLPYGMIYFERDERLYLQACHVPASDFKEFAQMTGNRDKPWEGGKEVYEMERITTKRCLSFDVEGTSMDTGGRRSFMKGDKVLAVELERGEWDSKIDFKHHPYWVVVLENFVLLKEIVAQDNERNTLTLHSINPSPEFKDFTIETDLIKALYMVIVKKTRQVFY